MKITSPAISSIPYIGDRELWTRNSFLIASLYAIRTVFNKVLDIKEPIEFKFTDDIKRTLDLRDNVKYPRVFFQVSGLRKAKERISGFSMQKNGIYHRSGEGESVKEGITFPIDLNMEFHYQHTDALQMLQIMEALVLLTFTPLLGFKMRIADAFEHEAQITFEDDITVNQFEIESSADPGSSEIVLPFNIKSFVGIITDKPWVNVVDRQNATQLIISDDLTEITIGI
jgi:hypothetical protein